MQVPFRRINLTGGSGYFDAYDTSGPQVSQDQLACTNIYSSTLCCSGALLLKLHLHQL